jgi:hypothetical protein
LYGEHRPFLQRVELKDRERLPSPSSRERENDPLASTRVHDTDPDGLDCRQILRGMLDKSEGGDEHSKE